MEKETIQNRNTIRQYKIIKQTTKWTIFINHFIHIDFFYILIKCNKGLSQLNRLLQYLQERYKVLHHLNREHHQAQGQEEYLVQNHL